MDDIDDETLMQELMERKKTLPVALECDPAEDITALRQCITKHDWTGAMVYLDRLFPDGTRNPAKIAADYDAWKKERGQ
jgi:hypothetical protein